MRCKVGDLCIAVGLGRPAADDTHGARGAIVEVVGPALDPWNDWSVVWPGHVARGPDGTFGCKDSDLLPLPGDEAEDETPAEIIRELTEHVS